MPTLIRRSTGMPVVAGLAVLLGCATATPDQTHRAERECFDEARHDGYRRLELTGAPIVVGDSVIADVRARRHGEEFGGTCTYNLKTRHADLSLQHASGREDWLEERARDGCREEAEDRRYQVRSMTDLRVKRERVRLNMELRRRGDTYFARCRFEDGFADLDIDR